MRKDEKFYPGNHEPLVSKDLFDQVQFVLTGKKHPEVKKHDFHLRGFLTCASCGCALTATKKGHDNPYQLIATSPKPTSVSMMLGVVDDVRTKLANSLI